MPGATEEASAGGWRAWNELVLWAPPALLLVAGWLRRWLADDAFIDLRILNNLLAGLGPVFNAGERVEAYTSPLWVAILALLGALERTLPGRAISLEWTAVLVGLGLSFAALACAGYGARRLWGLDHDRVRLLPFAALAIATIAPYWDFASSGLECSLVLAWLGLSFLGSTWLDRPSGPRFKLGLGLLFGLGPLVRPDLGVEAALWVGLLLACSEGLRLRLGCLAAAASLPLAYQVFRMGYFAALVPNTALAKEASLPYWSQGIDYLQDFAGPYHLRLLLALLALGMAFLGRRALQRGRRRTILIAAAPVLGGVVQGLYVVRVGGDFMHARMLLPPLFALSLPAAVIAAEGAASLALAALLAIYAGASLSTFRVPYDRWVRGGKGWIGDERKIYVTTAGIRNPVSLGDFHNTSWAANGTRMARVAQGVARLGTPGAGLYSDGFNSNLRPVRLASESGPPLVAFRPNVGLFSFAAGPLVYVCDPHGLPDPIGSRLRLETRSQPGHEKWAGSEWCVARRLAPGETGGLTAVAKIEAAQAALGCGEVPALLRAIDDRLTFRRFLQNVIDAPRLTRLRIAQDPAVARRELCQ